MTALTPATPATPPELLAPGDQRHQLARRLTGLDRAMLVFYVALALCEAAMAILRAGWPSAVALDATSLLVLLGFCVMRSWRRIVSRLLVLGMTAGVFELFTDASGERVVHSLLYPAHEPMIWASPVYMPIAWTIVLTELGYLAWRAPSLFPALSMRGVVALCALVGAVTVPFYEEMAYYAGWWRYAGAPHLGHTPLYVIAFEGLVAAILPFVTARLARRGFQYAVTMGAIVGVWMPVVALISWLLLGR
ncbi:MAG TPA: hypothetical protein VJN88_08020 [Ktedonobacterales bacterium]|nr:hypothetical protein [Ktedonobacterales bacterium]